jgi:anti-sigma B factor antagonist
MAPHQTSHFLEDSAVSVRDQDGYRIVMIGGEIDIASASVLRARLLDLLPADASPVIIDLSRVTFCDASGLAVLVAASRRAAQLGGVLRLAAPAPLTATILRLTGLDAWFEVFATVPEAVSAPVQPGARAHAVT